MQYDSMETAESVHTILTEMYGNPYPIREILRNTAPSCKDMVIRCELSGIPRNCEYLFEERLAGFGVCCMTNNQRPTYEELTEMFMNGEQFPQLRHVHVSEGGRANALSVVLKNNYSDFAYKITSNSNFKVMVFQAQEFPDDLSGPTKETLIEPNTESNIVLEPIYVESDCSMKNFPPSTRRCYFNDEGGLPLKGFYSLSECVLHCRIREIFTTCNCVPPFLPNLYNATVCLLTDLSCLIKWRESWIGFKSFYTEDDYIRSHPCSHCLPSCTSIKYDFRKTWKYLAEPAHGKYRSGIMKGFSNKEDVALVHVYFQLNYLRKMRQSVNGNWHYLMSYFGGICGLMFGASILSGVQFIYFLTGKFFYIWIMCARHFFKNHKRKNPVKPDVNVRALYWDELYPNNKRHNFSK